VTEALPDERPLRTAGSRPRIRIQSPQALRLGYLASDTSMLAPRLDTHWQTHRCADRRTFCITYLVPLGKGGQWTAVISSSRLQKRFQLDRWGSDRIRHLHRARGRIGPRSRLRPPAFDRNGHITEAGDALVVTQGSHWKRFAPSIAPQPKTRLAFVARLSVHRIIASGSV